ncbi:hypothetical protein Syun_009852 [Stephania yunnanensis]|uniref:Uncharacterized protein n=1 Tax=Stephania yunnanensis TaxID=152371 RepID=A0AAP0KFA9_9MAGN
MRESSSSSLISERARQSSTRHLFLRRLSRGLCENRKRFEKLREASMEASFLFGGRFNEASEEDRSLQKPFKSQFLATKSRGRREIDLQPNQLNARIFLIWGRRNIGTL